MKDICACRICHCDVAVSVSADAPFEHALCDDCRDDYHAEAA